MPMSTAKKPRRPAASEPTTKSRRSKAASTDTALVAQPPQAEPDRAKAADTGSAVHADVTTSDAPIVHEPQAAAPTEAVQTAAAASAPSPEPTVRPAHKLSALDAAAKVLAETGQAMSCGEMIAAMAAKGYWQSPRGRTPSGTLYSAILRELQTKGETARFRKSERGKFRFHSAP
jgi:hypothetical protein